MVFHLYHWLLFSVSLSWNFISFLSRELKGLLVYLRTLFFHVPIGSWNQNSWIRKYKNFWIMDPKNKIILLRRTSRTHLSHTGIVWSCKKEQNYAFYSNIFDLKGIILNTQLSWREELKGSAVRVLEKGR